MPKNTVQIRLANLHRQPVTIKLTTNVTTGGGGGGGSAPPTTGQIWPRGNKS